jgi:hypothetical protein
MKNTNFGLLSVVILLSFICLNSCASNPTINTEGKFPSPKGLCLAFMRTDIPMEQYSFLALKEDFHFMELDGVYATGDRAVIIPSGDHIIMFKYSIGNLYTDPMFLRFNFEAGKYYYLDYDYEKGGLLKGDKIEPFISDIPESLLDDARNKFENAKTFLEWSMTNPAALDGTWIKEKGSSLVEKITIAGHEFKITLPLGFYTGNIEGKLFFTENWIILYPARHYSTRNKTGEEFGAPFSFQPAWLNKETLYYEHTGDYLSITRTSTNSNFTLNNKAVTFKRIE